MRRDEPEVPPIVDSTDIMAAWPVLAQNAHALPDPPRTGPASTGLFRRLLSALHLKEPVMRSVFVLGAVALAFSAAPALAKDHVVKMLNRGKAGMMVFEPALVRIAPGDTVTFQPTDKGHDAESIAGMIPAGAQPFKGKLNQPLTVTFTKPGVYGYKCAPHYPMGMVGAVVVGSPAPNVNAARKVRHPGRAGQVFTTLLR